MSCLTSGANSMPSSMRIAAFEQSLGAFAEIAALLAPVDAPAATRKVGDGYEVIGNELHSDG
jgi:hypothetical protein